MNRFAWTAGIAALGLLPFAGSAFDYQFSTAKKPMDDLRYGKWMPVEKMNRETSFQNTDNRVLLVVNKENPAWFPKEDAVFRDGTATWKFQLLNNGGITLQARCNYATMDRYYLRFDAIRKEFEFVRFYRNKKTVVGKGNFQPDAQKKYVLQLIFKGDAVTFKINGKEAAKWVDKNTPLKAGLCGFGTNWGTKVYLESFSYDSAKPAAKPAAPKAPAAPSVKKK